MVKYDRERVRHAKLYGSASRIRDLVNRGDPEVVARHRAEWPELWSAIDDIVGEVGQLPT